MKDAVTKVSTELGSGGIGAPESSYWGSQRTVHQVSECTFIVQSLPSFSGVFQEWIFNLALLFCFLRFMDVKIIKIATVQHHAVLKHLCSLLNGTYDTKF